MRNEAAPAAWSGIFPYTGEDTEPPSMNFVWARNITERTVLRVLITGFGLVLMLLTLAAFIGARRAREIQAGAEELVRQELIVARLLNEVQAEESTLTSILHRLVRQPEVVDGEALLTRLRNADEAVRRVAGSGEAHLDVRRWADLQKSVAAFTRLASAVIQQKSQSPGNRDQLFLLHEQVLANVNALIASSTSRAADVDLTLANRSMTLASESAILLGACFVLALICAVLTVRMAANAIRRMEWQASELNQVSWQMVRTQEEAARRFSHELHDELGQSLAAIKANLTASREDDFRARRLDCIHLVDDAIANVRELSQLLRPVILDDFGLEAAVRWLGEKFSQRTGISVECSSNLTTRLAEDLETQLFRITQEALTNIARHSGATTVSIELFVEKDTVHLNISDNGRGMGMPSVEPSPSMGMVGMRARARQAGGELIVSTPRGGGLTLQVTVPSRYVADDIQSKNTSTAGR